VVAKRSAKKTQARKLERREVGPRGLHLLNSRSPGEEGLNSSYCEVTYGWGQ